MLNDWYERRDELEPGQVFRSVYGIVKLDHSVAGDATKWNVLSWCIAPGGRGYWSCDDSTIEPGDLTERLPDDYSGEIS